MSGTTFIKGVSVVIEADTPEYALNVSNSDLNGGVMSLSGDSAIKATLSVANTTTSGNALNVQGNGTMTALSVTGGAIINGGSASDPALTVNNTYDGSAMNLSGGNLVTPVVQIENLNDGPALSLLSDGVMQALFVSKGGATINGGVSITDASTVTANNATVTAVSIKNGLGTALSVIGPSSFNSRVTIQVADDAHVALSVSNDDDGGVMALTGSGLKPTLDLTNTSTGPALELDGNGSMNALNITSGGASIAGGASITSADPNNPALSVSNSSSGGVLEMSGTSNIGDKPILSVSNAGTGVTAVFSGIGSGVGIIASSSVASTPALIAQNDGFSAGTGSSVIGASIQGALVSQFCYKTSGLFQLNSGASGDTISYARIMVPASYGPVYINQSCVATVTDNSTGKVVAIDAMDSRYTVFNNPQASDALTVYVIGSGCIGGGPNWDTSNMSPCVFQPDANGEYLRSSISGQSILLQAYVPSFSWMGATAPAGPFTVAINSHFEVTLPSSNYANMPIITMNMK